MKRARRHQISVSHRYLFVRVKLFSFTLEAKTDYTGFSCSYTQDCKSSFVVPLNICLIFSTFSFTVQTAVCFSLFFFLCVCWLWWRGTSKGHDTRSNSAVIQHKFRIKYIVWMKLEIPKGVYLMMSQCTKQILLKKASNNSCTENTVIHNRCTDFICTSKVIIFT